MGEVQRGDGDAFAILFDRYHRLVLTTALKIVRDASEAEEVTQNVFLEVYRSAGKFDPQRGTLKVWLLQYAYHRAINRRNYLLLRQFYNRPNFDESMAVQSEPDSGRQFFGPEFEMLIREGLGSLNEVERRTVQEVLLEGWTLREVSERTGESFSNVRNHYYRGLKRLRGSILASKTEEDNRPRVILEVRRANA